MEKGRFHSRGIIIYAGLVVLVAALNAAAWNSAAFSDWYIAHIFPIWVNTYGRVTGIFPFSVGEWLLGAGVVLVLLAVALVFLWICVGIAKGFGLLFPGKRGGTERKSLRKPSGNVPEEARRFAAFRKFSRGFGIFAAWTVLCVCVIMTLNCFVLYHASTFSQQYFGEDSREHALVELIEVYNMVAEQCNELSHVIGRDEKGMAVYEGGPEDGGEGLDMEDMARKLMRQLGETYPQLDGYYPRPKALLSSDFMCQQHMQGYYFPFSMEANYNDVMHVLNFPAAMCHELAHLRGYIYEDEANFIAYLACVEAEDPFFRYSGYLSVLVYLNNDLYRAWKEEPQVYEEAVAVVRPVAVEERVWEDNIFVAQEEWDRINEKAWLDTDFVDKAADKFIDVNLKVNGVADGKVSYSRVVKLLLQYYRSNPLESAGESRGESGDESGM